MQVSRGKDDTHHSTTEGRVRGWRECFDRLRHLSSTPGFVGGTKNYPQNIDKKKRNCQENEEGKTRPSECHESNANRKT